MGISTELQYAKLDDLYLDRKESRDSGRHHVKGARSFSRREFLRFDKRDWVLDELAVSYLGERFLDT